MLKSLQIRNFALIVSLDIEFKSGLNIITGETGAGKSIIVDALMMALGERASTDFIREGEAKSIIEAIFSFPEFHSIFNFLKEEGIECESEELLFRRELMSKGTSRCFVNDTPISASILKKLSSSFIDFHGQHDHQSLLNPESHIELLDSIGNFQETKAEYVDSYNDLKNLIDDLREIKRKEKSLRDKEEIARFQLSEISKVAPKQNEDEEIENELKIAENSEFLFTSTQELHFTLYDDDNSCRDKLASAERILHRLSEIDKNFNDYLTEINSALVIVDEISKYIKNYNSSIQIEPDEIEKLRLRLQQIKSLEKKYGPIDTILIKQKQLNEDLLLIENFDEEIIKLKNQINDKQIELGSIAKKQTFERLATAKKIQESVELILKELGIQNAVFIVKIDSQPIDSAVSKSEEMIAIIDEYAFRAFPDGIDLVEFYISLNKGETPKPLSAIASGGEISRIMLSLKSIIARTDNIPILVFDEIDSGISGRIAQKVGIRMKELSGNHQIIAITHLPQIAALGDLNLSVNKFEENSRTYVKISQLDDEQKIYEVAKLISGEDITEAAIQSAKDLMIIENKSD